MAAIDRPFVLLGRGGSGTRLLSQIAQDAGIFLGNEINATQDSVEWVPAVYQAAKIRLAGGETETVPAQLRATAETVLAAAPPGAALKWGWKLPETMLIVPEVDTAFAAAKIVHLVRHPVTACLRRTHMTSRWNNPVGAAVLAQAYADFGRAAPDATAPQEHLDNAVSWAFQVGAVAQYCRDRLPAHRYLEIRYEDVIDDWPGLRQRLGDFLGYNSDDMIQPLIDSGRNPAPDPSDPRIAEVWDICRITAGMFGYSLVSDNRPLF